MPLIYWLDESGALDFVSLDATQSETHEDNVTITDHPVELGVNVTDHARQEPTRLTLEGVVSNMPNLAVDTDAGFETVDVTADVMADPGTQQVTLKIPGAPVEPSISGLINAGVGALKSAISGAPQATLTGNPKQSRKALRVSMLKQRAPRNRVRDVYEKLLDAQAARYLISVTTSVREHYDMLIERIALPRTAEDGSKATFQIDLRRIRIAESETVAAPEPAEARGALGKNRGNQGAKADKNAAAKEQVYESTLSSLIG